MAFFITDGDIRTILTDGGFMKIGRGLEISEEEGIRYLNVTGGSGPTIEIDDHLDVNSTNPVQNKIITEALQNIITQAVEIEAGNGINVDKDVQNNKYTISAIAAPENDGLNNPIFVDSEGIKFSKDLDAGVY